jgi:hypothetical protein
MTRFLIIFALAFVVIIGLVAIDIWLLNLLGDSFLELLISMICRLLGFGLLGLIMLAAFGE